MKRIICITLAAMLLLTSCGSQTGSDNENKQEPPVTTKTTDITALKYHWNISLKANENLKKNNVSTLLDKRAQQKNGAIQGLQCRNNNISFQFDTNTKMDVAEVSMLFSKSGYMQVMDQDGKMILDSSNIEAVNIKPDLLSSKTNAKMIQINLTSEGKKLLDAVSKNRDELTLIYDGAPLEATTIYIDDGIIEVRSIQNNKEIKEMAGYMNSSFGTYQFEVMEEPEKIE